MASLMRSALREHIFKIVFSYEFRKDDSSDDYISLYVDNITDESDIPLTLNNEDDLYIREKSKKIINMIPDIDEIISRNATGWSSSRIGKAELAILRLSVYEVLYDDYIPKSVAINEAVELAKKYGEEAAPGFINGILSAVAL